MKTFSLFLHFFKYTVGTWIHSNVASYNTPYLIVEIWYYVYNTQELSKYYILNNIYLADKIFLYLKIHSELTLNI